MQRMWQYSGGAAYGEGEAGVLQPAHGADVGEHRRRFKGKAPACGGRARREAEGEGRQYRPSHGGETLYRMDPDYQRGRGPEEVSESNG